jgi:hypothetical protein
MKLFYSPGACSLSPHIVAHEAGIDLELDNGEILTEGPAIVQYLADLKPESNLAPKNGTWDRVRLQEMLNYITSEIHKTYSPLWNPKVSTEVRKERTEYLRTRYALLDKQLADRKFLLETSLRSPMPICSSTAGRNRPRWICPSSPTSGLSDARRRKARSGSRDDGGRIDSGSKSRVTAC